MVAPEIRVLSYPVERQDGVNPFCGLWTESLRDTGGIRVDEYRDREVFRRPGAIHFHWPEYLICPGGWRPLRLARRAVRLLSWAVYVHVLRGQLVWTVHNDQPHGLRGSRVDRAFFRVFRSLVTHRIYLSETYRSAVEKVPDNSSVVKHPMYEVAPVTGSLPEGEGGAWLSFGEVLSYKGHAELVQLWPHVSARGDRLVVVGAGRNDRVQKQLEDAVATAPATEWRNCRLTDDELTSLIASSAGVILNYQDVLNSGAALLTLSCQRPVVLPDTPTFRELERDFGNDWVYLYDASDPQALADAIVRAGSGERRRNREWQIRSWDETGRQLGTLFRGLVVNGSGAK